MAWDARDTYLEGLAFFTNVVDQVPPTRWEDPSPCAGWRALDVLGHVGAAAEVGTRILRGGELHFHPSDPPGELVGDDPVAWWHDLADAARTAATETTDLDREVDSPMGRRSVRDGLSFPAVDLFIHGWDLATAVGGAVTFPDEAIAFTRALFDQVPEERARSARVFAAPRPAPEGASATAALLAFTGRDPDWPAR